MENWIKRNPFKIMTLLLIVVVLTNFQFMPTIFGLGSVGFSNLLYNILIMISIFLILAGPIGIIWFILDLILKLRISSVGIIIIVLGLFGYINGVIISNSMSKYAKGVSIRHANVLIMAIENYKKDKFNYPDSLNLLIPYYIEKIPKPGIQGIGKYEYSKLNDNYEIQFEQNKLMNFDFDVVIYNPRGEQVGSGDYPDLKETGYKNWKYYTID